MIGVFDERGDRKRVSDENLFEFHSNLTCCVSGRDKKI